jgi:hypothetical protein
LYFGNLVAVLQLQLQQLSLLSQASWGRLEMKPTRNKERRSTKHKSTRLQNLVAVLNDFIYQNGRSIKRRLSTKIITQKLRDESIKPN